MRYFAIVLAAAALGATAVAQDAPKPAFKTAGCSISKPAYLESVGKLFAAKKGVPVETKGGGVPVGIQATLDGDVSLAGSCRHLLDKEKKAGAVSTVVGYDMLVFITHPDNPADSVTLEQARAIFAGRLKEWKDVGGWPDQPIALAGRESEEAGVSVMLSEMVMNGEPLAGGDLKMMSSSEIEKEVERNRNSIAATGISSAKLRKVKMLKLAGVPPDREHFLDGSYPLVRPLYLVSKGKPKGTAKDFLKLVLSDEGQKVLGENVFTIAEYKTRAKKLKKG